MRISSRSAVYGSSLLALALLLVWSKWPEAIVVAAPPPPPPPGPTIEITKYFASDAVLHGALVDAYRLGPDRRFLAAFSEIHRMLEGSASEPVSAVARPEGFEIRDGAMVRGTLPDLADITDVLPLLEATALEVLTSHPLNLVAGKATPAIAGVTHQMDRSWTGASLESLEQLEKLWGDGNRQEALFRQIVRAQARLSFQVVDDARQADIVGARALALVAIALALKIDVREDEALVAASLGYWRAARQSTGSMPSKSAVRAYLERRDADLRTLARTGSDGALARYLLLRRLTTLQDSAGVDHLVQGLTPEERRSEPVIAAYIALGRLGTKGNGGTALAMAVLETTRQEGGIKAPLGVGTSSVTAFEEALVLRAPIRGTFLDEDYRRAFRRAHFYMGLLSISRHTLDELASIPAAEKFRAQLGSPPAGPGADFVAWLDAVLEGTTHRIDGPGLASRASTLPVRGALQARIFTEIRENTPWGDPVLRPATRALASGLDARPTDRVTLADAALDSLQAFNLGERLYRSHSTVTGGEDPRSDAYVARLQKDVMALVRLASDPRITGRMRGEAIGTLATLAAEDPALVKGETIQARYGALLAALPDDWPTHDQYGKWLEKRGRHADAERVVQRWVTKHGKDSNRGLDPATAMTSLARAQQAQGKLDRAWNSVQPAMRSGAFGPLSRGARIQLARGKREDALAIASGLEKRYGVIGSILVAEIHWRSGRHDEAARALLAARQPLVEKDWQVGVAETFSDVFAGHHADGIAAFDALTAAKVPLRSRWNLAARIGDPALAFVVLERVHPSLADQGFLLLVDRWKVKKRAEGEAAADAWLRTKPDWQAKPQMMFLLFDAEAWNVLWDVAPPETPGDLADNFWEFRAAAALRAGDSKRLAEMKEHYRKTPKGGRYDVLGRYLVDLVPHEEILPLADGRPGFAAEVAMAVALRREVAGNLDAANDWYRAVIETGAVNDAEYRAATTELSRWYGKTRARAIAKAK